MSHTIGPRQKTMRAFASTRIKGHPREYRIQVIQQLLGVSGRPAPRCGRVCCSSHVDRTPSFCIQIVGDRFRYIVIFRQALR
ncbi:hypothetical protein [Brevibacillus laterosporus]|uniref:hypothetical protein n=1 Tax=Brevibacillus laterosporus TaxID=1465 RepID=UPI001A7E5004|nr:hypothetical protein [Brevibacillus laterosporus]